MVAASGCGSVQMLPACPRFPARGQAPGDRLMTQAFIEALNWVPKSSSMTTTLLRAFEYAKAQAHRQVTIEHLLLALVSDSDAATVLQTCKVDFTRLAADLSNHL